ncbi:MAG: AAA family ATPase [Paracoccaceae bacterium]|jgi:uncharacterized protein YhaN|nr:AAA family ATPase [Paracoccaceae bacterium]
MRLRRLDLDFFGHFAGRSFDFGERPEGGADVHVIHGANEAGKTTLMEGWLRLLYGFPLREPYAFRHGRPSLQVSAELEVDGMTRRFTRLSKRTGNLLDGAGAAVPETALSPLLAGLSEDDYRKLLCLDDDTIERGGDEIAASEGDIGRLLFSAAAGVADLSGVLDGATEEADALFRPRASTSAFAGLRRTHKDLSDRIRKADVDAHRYRQLRDDLAAAETEEAEARAARRARLEARDRLRAQAEALPLMAEIAETDTALAPLAPYPETLDVDPERLVGMMTDRLGHAREAERLAAAIEAARAERDGIHSAPDLAALRRPLADLKPLRDRCAAAEADLPRRRDALAALLTEMRARLAEIGIASDGDVTPPVPDEPTLRALERAVTADAEAEAALATAARETAQAQDEAAEAARRLAAAEQTLADLPDTAPLLARHDAERVATAAAQSRHALAHAERQRETALAALALGPAAFDAAPALPLAADAAAALAADLDAAAQDVAREEAELEKAMEAEARLLSEIEAREAAPDLATDSEAAALRADRDRLWQTHRAALTVATADVFERALRADDAATATRLAQAGTLGAIREKRVALAEAERRRGTAEGALEAARGALETLEDRLAGLLSGLGLPSDTPARAFADWARRAEAALAADRAAAAEARGAAPALEAAERLRAALAEAMDAPDTPLDALMDMARERAAARDRQAQAVAAAREAAARAEATRARRATEEDAAAKRCKAAADTLSQAATALGLRACPVADALPVLRSLREREAERQGLARQVDGMARDADRFAEALAPHIEGRTERAAHSPVAAFDALADRAAEAETAQTRRAALAESIAADEAALADARAEVARIDDETALLARAFDATIPTTTLEELRAAVGQAQEAARLRTRRADLARQVLGRLGVESLADARAALAGLDAAALSAAVAEAERDIDALDARCREAGTALGAARQALEAVTGGAEVAALVSRRQTAELEMERTLLRHLELRLGQRLAETAIRRYRDAHRSGMMAAAEAAFRDLTNGAYARLTVQPEGDSEVLVAVAAGGDGDGAAKRVDAMSKGTRFQLYLALRAAAYDQMAATGTVLPFFCDDVFETFDEERTRAACGLLRRIGRAGQAVYLTHHRHVVEIAEEVCAGDLRIHRL